MAGRKSFIGSRQISELTITETWPLGLSLGPAKRLLANHDATCAEVDSRHCKGCGSDAWNSTTIETSTVRRKCLEWSTMYLARHFSRLHRVTMSPLSSSRNAWRPISRPTAHITHIAQGYAGADTGAAPWLQCTYWASQISPLRHHHHERECCGLIAIEIVRAMVRDSETTDR